MGMTDKITTYFIHKVDKSLDLEKINQVVFISFTSIISIFFYLVFGTFALINERYLLALILGTASAFNYIIYQYLYRSYKLAFCANSIVVVTAALFLYLLITGGAMGRNVYGTGFLWIFPFPVLVIAIKGLRKGTIISAVFLMLMVVVFIVNLYITSLPNVVTNTAPSSMYKVRYCVPLMVVSLVGVMVSAKISSTSGVTSS